MPGSLAVVLAALLPVVLIIALGWALRRSGALAEAFWSGAERLCYVVLLPAFLAHGLGTADLGAVPLARLAVCIVGPILAVSALLVAIRPRLAISGAAFTSVFQGSIRFNNYLGLAFATALLGAPGVGLAAVANGLIVPTVNVLSVLAFAAYGSARPSLAGTLKALATNPLILGTAAGAVWQATAMPVPGVVAAALRILGQAALPLGLLCVGAAFSPRVLGAEPGSILLACGMKFLALPALTAAACLAFGVSGPPALVAVLFAALPTATSAYILSRQLGGDAALMSAITTFQTLVSLATLPLTLALVLAVAG